jgi:hypothetical protein
VCLSAQPKANGKLPFCTCVSSCVNLVSLNLHSLYEDSHAVICASGNPSSRKGARHGNITSENADPPLSGLTMLACVLQTAKPPAPPAPLFIRRGGCRVITTLSFYFRAVEICQITSTRDRCSRKMSNNQHEGLSALLSPLDYTCSSKGMNTNQHVRTYN